MQVFCLILILLFAQGLGYCQSPKIVNQDDKIFVIAQKDNRKYDLAAIFYGVNFNFGDGNKPVAKIIKYVVLRDNKTNLEVKYETSGTVSAADFYFTEVWSPNEEYLVLPIGKFEGFGIYEAKEALKNVKSNKYFDTLKVKSENSGWFWHDFEKWRNDSTFSFRAGLDGDMFAFKYNLTKSELYCYEENCEESDIGINNKGKLKAIKKGNIEPTKIH